MKRDGSAADTFFFWWEQSGQDSVRTDILNGILDGIELDLCGLLNHGYMYVCVCVWV